MSDDSDMSLGGDQTVTGRRIPVPSSEVSLGDARTVGDLLSDQDARIDGIREDDFETRYRVEGTLGQGGMGLVQHCFCKSPVCS
jgi:hypothetical protein